MFYLTEPIKLTKKDIMIHKISTVNYESNYLEIVTANVINNNDIIKLKQQILENQKKAETLDSIIPFLQKELTAEQLGLLKVIADPESMKILAYLTSEQSEPTQE